MGVQDTPTITDLELLVACLSCYVLTFSSSIFSLYMCVRVCDHSILLPSLPSFSLFFLLSPISSVFFSSHHLTLSFLSTLLHFMHIRFFLDSLSSILPCTFISLLPRTPIVSFVHHSCQTKCTVHQNLLEGL